jgi:hypothetical protein
MDVRKFASKYIKPDHVREGPITTRIISVFESEQYGRPVLELETGSQFTLNDGNTNTLVKAWGYETDGWIEQELELSLGSYRDWKTDPPEERETVKVRAISPPKSAAANGGTPASDRPVLPPSRIVAAPKDTMEDEIPFVLAFLAVSAAAWLVISSSSLVV